MIKDKYIDLVKSRVDICQLAVDLHPETTLRTAGPTARSVAAFFIVKKHLPCYLTAQSTDTSALVAERVVT